MLWGALLAAVYVASRLYVAAGFPIFIDEAMHIDWARATDHSYPAPDAAFEGRWLSIKLFALATRPAAPFDELVAARLLVVGLGLTAAVACYLVGRDLFSRRAGALAAALYVALPFSVIYTSLAMTDSVQFVFGAWAVLLAVRLARTGRWVYAALLPLALAAAVLAKFTGGVLAALPAAAVLLLAPQGRRAAAALRALPALLTPFGLFAIFYSYGLLQIVKTKAAESSASAGGRLWPNLATAGGWLWGLLTPSVALLAAVAFVWLALARGRRREGLFVLALFGLAVLPFAAVSQIWHPRYILAAVVPVALAVGRLLDLAAGLAGRRLGGRRAPAAAALTFLIVGALSWPALRSADVLFALPDAALPEAERFQFVTGWPSGYGVRHLADYLRAEAAATPGGVTVARTYWADHPLQSLNIYLAPSPSLSLFTLADEDESSARSLRWQSARRRTLLVLTTDRGVPHRIRKAGAPLLDCCRPLWSYTRPGGETGFVVYELNCGDAPAAR